MSVELGWSPYYWSLPFGVTWVPGNLVEFSFLCFFLTIWMEKDFKLR